jgi:iron complex transport system substrate-binding protein
MKLKRLSKLMLSMLLVLASVGAAGCSSKADQESGTETKKQTEEVDSSDNSTQSKVGDNPISIETKFGVVEITEIPQRIVALGWGDAETALALGAEPVGASDWLAFGGDGVGPWLEGAYENTPAIIGTMELDYEQIASLKPDLILDVRSSGDQERYERLSQIATTVGIPEGGDGYLTSYQQQLEMISKALGKEEEGKQLLKDVDTAFENVQKKYPQFADKIISVGAYTSEGWGAYVAGDSRVDFMTSLGFVNKPEIEEASKGEFYIPVSDEQLDILDADLTVIVPIWVDKAEITDNPLYQQIKSVADGRSVILEGDYVNAFSTGTVPSLLWAIDELPPIFEKALEGGA